MRYLPLVSTHGIMCACFFVLKLLRSPVVVVHSVTHQPCSSKPPSYWSTMIAPSSGPSMYSELVVLWVSIEHVALSTVADIDDLI